MSYLAWIDFDPEERRIIGHHKAGKLSLKLDEKNRGNVSQRVIKGDSHTCVHGVDKVGHWNADA